MRLKLRCSCAAHLILRRVSDGFPAKAGQVVCWGCGTRRTTELHYRITPGPLRTHGRAVRHRLRNYKVGRLDREEKKD